MLYRIHSKKRALWMRAIQGAAAITFVELCVGIVVNRILKLGVWDYSQKRFHLWGQICLHYSLLWLGLTILVSPLCGKLHAFFRNTEQTITTQ